MLLKNFFVFLSPLNKESREFTKKGMKIFHWPVYGVNLVCVTPSTTNHQLSPQPHMGLGQILFGPIWEKSVLKNVGSSATLSEYLCCYTSDKAKIWNLV
jgi:hypothetical protein